MRIQVRPWALLLVVFFPLHIFFSSPLGKNIFFSPMSVTVALSMTLLGARGRTAEEMLGAFGATKENETNWHAFIGSVSSSKGKSPMTVANKMFVEKSFSVLSAYVEQLKKLYAVEHGTVSHAFNFMCM